MRFWCVDVAKGINMKNQISLIYDGALAPYHTVSLRTLSYTLPHFQRALDKTAYFVEYDRLTKYKSLPRDLYYLADLYVGELEKGSLKIPFLSELLKGVPDVFKGFLTQPYEEAVHEVAAHRGVLRRDLETAKANANVDNLAEITQEDVIAAKGEATTEFAQAAILQDLNYMLSVVRQDEGAMLSIEADSPKGFQRFEFDRKTAVSFSRIAGEKRLADPVIYRGFVLGVEEQRRNKAFPYAVKFLSLDTRQEMKVLLADLEDATVMNRFNLGKKGVRIWGAPIASYNAYDPVRGDVVFVGLIDVDDN